MSWAQKLVEAEGLSVVSLIGFINCWVLADCDWGLWAAAGPGYSWDGDSPVSGFSLGSGGIFPPLLQLSHPSKPSSRVSVLFPPYKDRSFPHLPFFGCSSFFLGAFHN